MQKSALLLTNFLLTLGGAGAAHAEQFYAQSNLQLQKGQLTPVNYRKGDPIPVGTVIKVLDKSSSGYQCETDGGLAFKFVPHKQIRQPIEKVFALFISSDDPRPRINKLSPSDQALVKKGELEVGMSRDAVLLSAGPPPSHKTPNLNSSTWLYWKSKFGTFKVVFDAAGKVSALPDYLEAPPPPPPAQDFRFAATNIHTLEGKVSWVNYLKGPLIPIGTKIEVTEIDDDEVEFKNAQTGEEYTFENDMKQSGMKAGALFERFFAKTPADTKLASLDPAAQKKVKGAEIEAGMSKDAVLMALGPPPPHETPSLDSSTWTYWKSRLAKMKVTFDGTDKVKTIE